MLPIESAFKVFTDRNGKPLENGYIYFGLPNLNPVTSPVTVYWDAAGTQPAAQPLRTVNGYIMRSGTPANVFFDGSYSELVLDSKKRQVFYARTSDDFSIATMVLNFLTTIASGAGSSLIGFIQAGINAIARTVQDKARERVSVFDFMTAAQIADVKSGALTLDVIDAIEDALENVLSFTPYKELLFPAGKYRHSRMIDIGYPGLSLRGDGRTISELCFTGAGVAVQFTDQHPNNGAYAFGGSIRSMGIRGNAASSTLLRIKNVNHFLAEDINLRESSNAIGVGLQVLGCVCATFKDIVCSTNAQLMTSRLQNGIVVDRDPTTLSRATANKFDNVIIEGMLGDGIQLINSDQSLFVGGTSENHDGNGVTIVSGSRMNTFISVAFENSVGFADIYDAGFSNRFENCYSKKLVYFDVTSLFGRLEGGFHQSVNVAGDFITLSDFKYSFFGPGGTIVPSNSTSTRNLFNVVLPGLTFATKAALPVVVGASPYTYENGSGLDEEIVVRGGTTTQVVFDRGAPIIQLPLEGMFRLAPKDKITVSYSDPALPPTVVRVPFGVNFI